ncbi:hypothetical protein BDV59DRAFT_187510 [Aspergillus ambiguus]|uniref:uncharacterized protein n=1 Tax=Aspergillus ambiguus TaxID=176160 RepID=UPI003CCD2F0F
MQRGVLNSQPFHAPSSYPTRPPLLPPAQALLVSQLRLELSFAPVCQITVHGRSPIVAIPGNRLHMLRRVHVMSARTFPNSTHSRFLIGASGDISRPNGGHAGYSPPVASRSRKGSAGLDGTQAAPARWTKCRPEAYIGVRKPIPNEGRTVDIRSAVSFQ